MGSGRDVDGTYESLRFLASITVSKISITADWISVAMQSDEVTHDRMHANRGVPIPISRNVSLVAGRIVLTSSRQAVTLVGWDPDGKSVFPKSALYTLSPIEHSSSTDFSSGLSLSAS